MKFVRTVDDELQLELMHVGLARELFLAIDHSRDHLREWLRWVDDTRQILDVREFLRMSMAGWAEGRMVHCAIRCDGELCGSVSIGGINATHGVADIGYWLNHDRQGRGIVTRCVAEMTKLAFEDLGLTRLQLEAAEGNARSWAIPERLGWTYEGTKRQSIAINDRQIDMRLYSLLSSD